MLRICWRKVTRTGIAVRKINVRGAQTKRNKIRLACAPFFFAFYDEINRPSDVRVTRVRHFGHLWLPPMSLNDFPQCGQITVSARICCTITTTRAIGIAKTKQAIINAIITKTSVHSVFHIVPYGQFLRYSRQFDAGTCAYVWASDCGGVGGDKAEIYYITRRDARLNIAGERPYAV